MLPHEVQAQLEKATLRLQRQKRAGSAPHFESRVCGNGWDRFIEEAAGRCYLFIQECLGPFQMEPLPIILPIPDSAHAAGANASFEPGTGQVRLCSDYVWRRDGTTLEKLCHELLHANLNDFPEGDPFYEEGIADYGTWVLAHAPYWGRHREAMVKAAAHNIALRRERAMRTQTDYDRKRWAGGLYFSVMHGPFVLARIRQKKIDLDLTW